jgi:uncharacterized protein with HEPN domain
VNKPWEPYALHVLDAIAKIRRIKSRGDIAQDDILYDAALRNLQTLAEATQQLPDRQKAFCPNIPWRQIGGFRNILVHNYLGDIDPLTIAAVIDTHLPALEDCVRTMLQEADPRSSG